MFGKNAPCPNAELNFAFRFSNLLNLNLNFAFGSVRFRFEPISRTGPCHHYYGATVFCDYDLSFGKAKAEASGEGVDDSSDADDEGEGDSIGSQVSDEEAELSDAASMTSFIDQQSASDDDEEEYSEPSVSDEGQEDTKAQFAAVYDVDMDEIFGNGNESVYSVPKRKMPPKHEAAAWPRKNPRSTKGKHVSIRVSITAVNGEDHFRSLKLGTGSGQAQVPGHFLGVAAWDPKG
ncbi:hypothetical protein B0H10DRAFT_1941957 [Mycena sp. CBHHK59/15]|nr:hypothetical protein B0H10DRAFT_1941957 [Mycena sp. CBHHK59/15]